VLQQSCKLWKSVISVKMRGLQKNLSVIFSDYRILTQAARTSNMSACFYSFRLRHFTSYVGFVTGQWTGTRDGRDN